MESEYSCASLHREVHKVVDVFYNRVVYIFMLLPFVLFLLVLVGFKGRNDTLK